MFPQSWRLRFRLVLGLFLLGNFASSKCDAAGPVQVRGYHRRDGTYVAPHTRSAPGTATSSAGSTSGSSWPSPRTSALSGARTAFRSTARTMSRIAAAGSSLADEETQEEKLPSSGMRPTSSPSPDEVAEAARIAEKKAAQEQELAEVEAQQLKDEEENKAATRLKRIKLLISEKKGKISSNLKDSLREIVKKYPHTESAKEAQKILDE